MSSKLVVLRSRTCSREATICIYFFLDKVFRNFFTSLDSSMVSPSDADLDEISDSFPTKRSIVSSSFILSLLNSAIRVCSLASLTLSAPTCLAFIASQTPFAVSMSPTCKIRASGMD